MLKKLMLAVILAAGLTACQKYKVADKTAETSEQTTRKPNFKFQESIPPELLVMIKKDLIDDGYIAKAKDLTAEYDFATGKRKKVVTMNPEIAARDYPTTSVSGVGTVLANVEFVQNVGSNETTSLFSCSSSSSIQFNAMNSGSAIHAFDNTTAPSGTFVQVPSTTSSVGLRLPHLQAKVTDIDGYSFYTNFFPLYYTADPFGSGTPYLSYVSSGNILQSPPGPIGCSSIYYLDDVKIKFGSSGVMTINDSGCGLCLPTQVQAYIYYRSQGSLGSGWSNWVSEDQPANSPLHDLQVRIYLILI